MERNDLYTRVVNINMDDDVEREILEKIVFNEFLSRDITRLFPEYKCKYDEIGKIIK